MNSKDEKLNQWNELKKKISDNQKRIVPKIREVYWVSIGENVGYEQNGKGDIFSRPVLILKVFSRSMFFGIPLSTKIKEGTFFHKFKFLENYSNALLVQGRLYDTKRIENKLGMINVDDFNKIKSKLKSLLEL